MQSPRGLLAGRVDGAKVCARRFAGQRICEETSDRKEQKACPDSWVWNSVVRDAGTAILYPGTAIFHDLFLSAVEM